MLFAKPSRRDFLKGTGILIVSFSLPSLTKTAFAESVTPAKTVALDDVDAFLAIDASGGVTLYSGKVDLGTGIGTALTQIVAEELDVPLARVQVVEGDTALTPAQGKTWGSLSIQNGGVQIRQAAATARHALLQEAAKRLGVPAEDLIVERGTEQGTVRSRSGGEAGHLWRADRRQDIFTEGGQAGAAQGPDDVQDRGAASSPLRHPG